MPLYGHVEAEKKEDNKISDNWLAGPLEVREAIIDIYRVFFKYLGKKKKNTKTKLNHTKPMQPSISIRRRISLLASGAD